MVVIATFITWTLLMDALTRRRWTFKRIFEGEPVIVLRDGALVRDASRNGLDPANARRDATLAAARTHVPVRVASAIATAAEGVTA